MANQKRVTTTYDSGDNNTAKKKLAPTEHGDWGNKVPVNQNADGNESALQDVMDKFNDARKFIKDNYEEKWGDQWKCYNNMRTRRGYEGVADDFIPETFTIIETVKANVAGGKPKANFVAMREEQRQDTQVLNQLMDFYWDQNRMTQKTLNWVQDMLVYGSGILMVSWEGDMPRTQNIPLNDFFFDPTATQMNNPSEMGYPKYVGYRYLTDLKSLKRKKLVDPDTGEMTEQYTGLDDIPEMETDWDALDKDQKEAFMGSTLGKDANKHQIECIVMYTVGDSSKKIVVANRKKVIYNGENPYYRTAGSRQETVIMPDGTEETMTVELPEIKPFFPFAILRNYVDSSLFLGKGDVEVILPLQEALNDIANQKRDNLTFVLNNMWQIDPQFQHLIEQIDSTPGAVFPIPRGALAPIEKQVITSEADTEMMRIKDEMRRATAADEAVQGVSQEKGRVTATEVQAQLNQASQRFSTKLTTLEDEGYAQLFRIYFKMVQIFVDQKMAVRVLGPEGTAWKDFDPNEYTGEYEPKIELESTSKALMAEEGQKFLNLHQMVANNPLINQQEFLRVYLEKVFQLPETQIKRLLDVPQQMGMGPGAMPPGMAMMMGGAGGPGGGSAPAPTSPVPSGPLPTGY